VHGSLRFWHGEHELLATAFPKEHGVRQAEVVESKRLSATMDFIKERQRERIEAKVAKTSTTLRKARLLRAGTPRWTSPGSPSVAGP
jgi:RNase P/RNase MRP subunit POP5